MKNSKPRKPLLSPQAKRNLGNTFGSLISNQRAINSAKELPFWVWIIFLVISVFIPVIPSMVNVSKTYGSSFMKAGYNYGADVGLHQMSKKLQADGYDLKIEKVDGVNKLLAYKDNQQVTEIDAGDATATQYTYSYVDVTKSGAEGQLGQYAYRFVYTTDANYDAVYKKLIETKYVVGTIEPSTVSKVTDPKYYIPGFILITPSHVTSVLYKADTTTAANASYGSSTYNHLPEGSIFKNMKLDTASQSEVFSKWCEIFDLTYLDAKATLFRNNTLIFISVYLGTVLFMGLLIFLLTRGKNNVFRYLSWYTCEKIAFYAALSPAILGMCLGFAIPAMATMGFILFFGLRIMWISMRQLRPQV